ncbi:MAG: DUF5406 domain-containing protein [Lachnospiraceae bacterium]|nr:DUF5406 domain-containing protein [Lachnospiraceae bacterium]
MAIKNYDPNIWEGIHTVRITIQQWEYVGHITEKVHGNCKGRDVLDFDFECEDGNLENDCNFYFHEDSDYFTADLKDENGNTLFVNGDAHDFNRMIVAVEIMDYVEE